MKNCKNILLAVLAALMLVGFAAAIPSPTISDDAYDAYMDMAIEEE